LDVKKYDYMKNACEILNVVVTRQGKSTLYINVHLGDNGSVNGPLAFSPGKLPFVLEK
jgi:hypothetical protein